MNRCVIIRADGSKEIGMGHLNRASIICKNIFINYSDEAILLINNDTGGQSFLVSKDITIQSLPVFNSIDDELKFLSKYIIDKHPDIFILDVLNHIEYNNFLIICKNNNVVSIVITDESEKMYDLNADIILNGNPNQLEYNYDSFLAKCLIGPRYFIMDQDYQYIENNPPNEPIKNILVSLGGSDHNNLLFDVLKILDNIFNNINIIIITTKASGYINKLKNILLTFVNTVELYMDVKSLSQYWVKCDIAITAGGNTLFERISTRTPGATICQLERQMEISNYFMEIGVNYNVGLGTELSLVDMQNNLQFFFNDVESHKQQYINAKNVVSGDGFKLMMEELHNNPKLCNY